MSAVEPVTEAELAEVAALGVPIVVVDHETGWREAQRRSRLEVLGVKLLPRVCAHLAALMVANKALGAALEAEFEGGYEPSLEVDGALQDISRLVQ